MVLFSFTVAGYKRKLDLPKIPKSEYCEIQYFIVNVFVQLVITQREI
jgi:hypothetical protein